MAFCGRSAACNVASESELVPAAHATVEAAQDLISAVDEHTRKLQNEVSENTIWKLNRKLKISENEN